MSDDIDQDPNEQASMESKGEEQEDHFGRSTVSLTQHVLGLHPYVLIEAKYEAPESDDDDGLRLATRCGGGVESIGLLPLLLVTTLPAEENPLTAAVRGMLELHPNHGPALPATLAAFANYVGFPMPDLGK
jgi:hypothetical protein